MAAWYRTSRTGLLADSGGSILGQIHDAAANDGWQIDTLQDHEWPASIPVVKSALSNSETAAIEGS